MAVLVVLGTVSGVAVAAGTTDIVVSAQNDTLAPGETTKVTVAISDADGGVGSADLRVELTDPSVATVQDVVVEPETSSAFRNVDIDADGAGANVNFAASTTEQDTGEVALLTVTVEAAAAGATDIEVVDNPQDVVNGVAVGDEAGASYTIDSVGSTTLTVEDPNTQPTADAGDDQTVEEGAGVTLDGTGSSDPDGDTLTYAWTQTGGPDVSLSDTSVAEPTFTAPEVDTDTTLTFDLEVTDPDGASDTDTVEVTVQEVAPANFQVSNLDAPDSATQGDNITVSADVTNDGDEEATQTVQFRLDVGDDGFGDAGDVVLSQDVELDPEESTTVEFTDIDTSELAPGDYTHGVVTDDDSATATISINEEPTASETSVSLSPESSEVVVGEVETYDVVVDNADGGVGAYELTVSLDDSSVASITDVELGGGPDAQTQNVTFADDGSSVTVSAALADTSDTGSVTIASVTVEGVAEGSSDLSVDVQALGNEEGDSYTVTEENGASISVVDLPPVGDFPNPPTDPDDDGLYEDVNGDGKFNIVDVQALFANLDDETVQNYPDAYDFNGDGSVDVVDVQKLYNEVLS
jgi:hypothetical protein